MITKGGGEEQRCLLSRDPLREAILVPFKKLQMKGHHQTNVRGYRNTGNGSTKRVVVKVLSRRVSENTRRKRPWGKEPTTVHLPGSDGSIPDDLLGLPGETVFFYPVSCTPDPPLVKER